jgi:hypothetical protein
MEKEEAKALQRKRREEGLRVVHGKLWTRKGEQNQRYVSNTKESRRNQVMVARKHSADIRHGATTSAFPIIESIGSPGGNRCKLSLVAPKTNNTNR